MSISSDEVARIARLAKLELDANEAVRMTRDLAGFLAYAERLPAGDGSAAAEAGPPRWREDRPEPGLTAGEALAPAPERDGDFFRVPPAIGGGEPA